MQNNASHLPEGTPTTALFAGSFDPFTIAHASIVARAMPLFTNHQVIKTIVLQNEHKKGLYSVAERVERIAKHYAHCSNIRVVSYNNLTMDFAKQIGANVIIKGVRNVKDFEYERQQADVNKQMGGIDTLFFFAEPHLESISSSLVRELLHFGKDVSHLII